MDDPTGHYPQDSDYYPQFKQMVNVLNLNIKNNGLVGININILILSMT